jgi:signal transduction histidine kinase
MLERLPHALELAVFRIRQESLTNVQCHSGSRTAEVTLQLKNAALIAQVKDAGKGVASGAMGVGLRSMQERVRQLKGEFEFSSGPNGTIVTATFPYNEQSMSTGAS